MSVKVSLKKTSKNKYTSSAKEASIPTSMMCGGLTRLLVQDNWTYAHYLVQMCVQLQCKNNEQLSVSKYMPMQPAKLLQMDDNYLYETKDAYGTFIDKTTPLVIPYVLMSNSVTPSLGPVWDSYVEIAVKMYDADLSNGVGFLPNSSVCKDSMFDLELTGSLGSIVNTKVTSSFANKTGWKTDCYNSNIGTRIILPILNPTGFPSWQIDSHMPLWTLVPRCDLGVYHMPKPVIVSYVFETDETKRELVLETNRDYGFFHINDYLIKLFKKQYMTHLSSIFAKNGCSAKTVNLQTGRFDKEAEGFLFLPLGLSPTKAQMRLHLNELRQCIRLARTSTQSRLIEKLTPWIRAWKDYYTFPDFLQLSLSLQKHTVIKGSVRLKFLQVSAKIDSGVALANDSTFAKTYLLQRLSFAKQANISLFKMLWRWACRRHPKKNRQWIKSKYFHTVKEKKSVSYLTKKVIFSVCQTSGTYRFWQSLPSH
jgi:hypothetical protein